VDINLPNTSPVLVTKPVINLINSQKKVLAPGLPKPKKKVAPLLSKSIVGQVVMIMVVID
jgi:hypothetical protein